MITLREVFLAAIKSLSRGKTFLQALLAFWISPALLKAGSADPGSSNPEDRTPLGEPKPRRSPHDFLKEAEGLFLDPVEGGDALERFALRLGAQFGEGLLRNPACMLPSYNHQLPNRSEHGRYLALDVGGSTLRIALVELRGSAGEGEGEARRGGESSRILRLESFKIEREIKNLEGMAFFDWMARRIVDTVSKEALDADHTPEKPLLMGLAWSFPIEYVVYLVHFTYTPRRERS